MAIPMLIVSGFLGAGKTTCIQQLLRQLPDIEKVMIIENDFGTVSYDADVLGEQGVQLKALPSGCICCSLAGNFLQALHSVLTKADVDLIFIEPSGVAKLSDVLRVCELPEVAEKTILLGAVTVVDGQKGIFHLRQFGEFYGDQIQYANTILLNRMEPKPDWYDETIEAIRALNGHAKLITDSWEHLSLPEILLGTKASFTHDSLPEAVHHHHNHEHHHHGDEIFTAVTLDANDIITAKQWRQKVEKLLAQTTGTILRIKGIVPSLKGYISIQYSGDSIEIEPTDVKGQSLTVIGAKIDTAALQERWQA